MACERVAYGKYASMRAALVRQFDHTAAPPALARDESDVRSVIGHRSLHGLARKGARAQNDHILHLTCNYLSYDIHNWYVDAARSQDCLSVTCKVYQAQPCW